jgi:hypothetical protein
VTRGGGENLKRRLVRGLVSSSGRNHAVYPMTTTPRRNRQSRIHCHHSVYVRKLKALAIPDSLPEPTQDTAAAFREASVQVVMAA